MRSTWIIFIVITLFSPWLWLLIINPSDFVISTDLLYKTKTHLRLTEINTYRSQALEAGWGLLAKIIINKYTWWAKDAASRIGEIFDLHYLVMEGDIDHNRSTGKSGVLYLWLLPPIVWTLMRSKNKILWILLLATSLLPALIENHFYTPIRIPQLLVLNYLAAQGLASFPYWYWLLLLWEVGKLIHYFFIYYL